jgi:hypothetical protein
MSETQQRLAEARAALAAQDPNSRHKLVALITAVRANRDVAALARVLSLLEGALQYARAGAYPAAAQNVELAAQLGL